MTKRGKGNCSYKSLLEGLKQQSCITFAHVATAAAGRHSRAGPARPPGRAGTMAQPAGNAARRGHRAAGARGGTVGGGSPVAEVGPGRTTLLECSRALQAP
jgi:hypothetical protein